MKVGIIGLRRNHDKTKESRYSATVADSLESPIQVTKDENRYIQV